MQPYSVELSMSMGNGARHRRFYEDRLMNCTDENISLRDFMPNLHRRVMPMHLLR